jgi:hypothetical protein
MSGCGGVCCVLAQLSALQVLSFTDIDAPAGIAAAARGIAALLALTRLHVSAYCMPDTPRTAGVLAQMLSPCTALRGMGPG